MSADILTLLQTLATLRAQQRERTAQEAAALPAAVRQRLAAHAARFAPAHLGLAREVARIEAQVKAAVLAHGASVRGARLQAVYRQGRATWDDHALQGFATMHPAILGLRSVGQPSVTLRTVRESP